MKNKLSEELKHCLDGNGCGKCVYLDEKVIISCRNLLQNAYEKIKYFEDLEEQGLLLKLPCKVGDTLYHVNPEYSNEEIEEYTVTKFHILKQSYRIKAFNVKGFTCQFRPESIGKTVFFTQAEAEEALKRMEGEK